MEFDAYQELAAKTANKDLPITERLPQAGLGIAGEGGETANKIKKALYHKHSIAAMRAEILEEVGDTLWYAAEVCSALGASLNDIAAANILKLSERYPDGFSAEASINRTR